MLGASSATLFRSTLNVYTPSYTVDLVSLPPSPVRTQPAGPAAAQPRAEPPRAEAKAAQPAAKKPQAPAAPSRTAQPTPVREQTRDREGEEAARVRADRLRKLEELEQETQRLYESIRSAGNSAAGSPAEVRPSTSSGAPAKTAAVGGQAGPVGGSGAPSDLRFRAYYDRIWSQIKSAWVLPAGVAAREQQLLAVVRIRIAPSGVIEHYWIEKASGNVYYDQSAIRAISKANPLPPLPYEAGNKPLEVGVNFRVTE